MPIASARDARSCRKNATPAADDEFTVRGQAAFVSAGLGAGSSYPLTPGLEKKGAPPTGPGAGRSSCAGSPPAGLVDSHFRRSLFGVGLGPSPRFHNATRLCFYLIDQV